MPCDHCVKRAGRIALGQEICKRQSLVGTRFDHLGKLEVSEPLVYSFEADGFLDLFEVARRGKKMEDYKQASSTATVTKGSMYIGYQSYDEKDLAIAYVKVSV